jgi:hypothetical protein
VSIVKLFDSSVGIKKVDFICCAVPLRSANQQLLEPDLLFFACTPLSRCAVALARHPAVLRDSHNRRHSGVYENLHNMMVSY